MRNAEDFLATKLGGPKLSTRKPDGIKVMCGLSTLLKIDTAGETFRVQTT